jgi:hypothetical protein
MVDTSALQNAALICDRASDTLRDLHELAEIADDLLAKIRAAESAIDECDKEMTFSEDVVVDLNGISMGIFRVGDRVKKSVDAINSRIRCIENVLGTLQRMSE